MAIRKEINAFKAARGDIVRALVAWSVVIVGLALVTKFGPAFLIGRAGRQFRVDHYHGALRPVLDTVLSCVGTGLILIAGIYASRRTAGAVTSVVETQLGTNRGGPVGFLVVIIGYILVSITFVQSGLGFHLGSLLLGGAFAGVIIGIAAQQSLANFFAGLILLAVRPFSIGEEIVVRSGALGGEYSGIVTSMSIFYVNILTDHGRVALPNAGVLQAAVGPGAKAPQEAPLVKEEEQSPAHEEDRRS
jgi:small-conductance mechanosensitive channel